MDQRKLPAVFSVFGIKISIGYTLHKYNNKRSIIMDNKWKYSEKIKLKLSFSTWS